MLSGPSVAHGDLALLEPWPNRPPTLPVPSPGELHSLCLLPGRHWCWVSATPQMQVVLMVRFWQEC